MKIAELVRAVTALQAKILSARDLLGIDSMKQRVTQLQEQMTALDFWHDQENAQAISQELSNLERDINSWEHLARDVADILEVAQLDQAEHDISMIDELEASYVRVLKQYQQQEFKLLLSGHYDKNSALVSIHAGSGGTDAQDWAEILLRMYMRFVEQNGCKVEILEMSRGTEAGIKSCTMQVTGQYAYGYLQAEHGVHRLVRISPFDAEKMRHTSFALVQVLPFLEEVQTSDIVIDMNDVRVDTFRASGAGGQHVNKTESAVRLTHQPTGIVVSCQSERSQLQNKETAMKILRSKLFQFEQAQQEEERKQLRGEYNEAAWGNQIRSYVMHPYKMVKDTRTGHETPDVQKVVDGDIMPFIEAYLRAQI